jgi:hypothetical protein
MNKGNLSFVLMMAIILAVAIMEFILWINSIRLFNELRIRFYYGLLLGAFILPLSVIVWVAHTIAKSFSSLSIARKIQYLSILILGSAEMCIWVLTILGIQ